MSKMKFVPCMLMVVSLSLAMACGAPLAAPVETETPAPSPEVTIYPTHVVGATSARLTLVTGNDGTADNPVFELLDNSAVPVYTTTLDNPGDLQPNQTDVYEFSVPVSFCDIAIFRLTKPSSSGADDSWLPTEIYIELDGIMVFFYRIFSDQGPLVAGSVRDGNWSGIDAYRQQCGN